MPSAKKSAKDVEPPIAGTQQLKIEDTGQSFTVPTFRPGQSCRVTPDEGAPKVSAKNGEVLPAALGIADLRI